MAGVQIRVCGVGEVSPARQMGMELSADVLFQSLLREAVPGTGLGVGEKPRVELRPMDLCGAGAVAGKGKLGMAQTVALVALRVSVLPELAPFGVIGFQCILEASVIRLKCVA